MKQNNIALKTLAIKARMTNHIRKTLFKKDLDKISNEEKVLFFNEVYKINNETHWELISYKHKRKEKRKIQEAREKRRETQIH